MTLRRFPRAGASRNNVPIGTFPCQPSRRRRGALCAGLLWIAAVWLPLAGAETPPHQPPKAEGFFGLDRLHSIHLTFASNAWAMMQTGPVSPPGPGRDGSPSGVGPRSDRDPGTPPRPGGAAFGPGFVRPPGPMEIEFPSVPATVEINGQRLESVSVRFKGNSSFNNARRSLKRSFKLDFNDLVKGQRFEGLDKLNLNNNTMDPSQMAEALAYDLCRQAGIPSPRTAFVQVDLTIEGLQPRRCLGLYTAVEQVEADFLRSRFGKSGGLLLKPETPEPLSSLGSTWAAYERWYEPKGKVSPEQAARLLGLVRLIQEAPDDEFERELPRQMDLDGLLRFLAVGVVVANLDGPLFNGHNFYLYLDPDADRWCWIPWDMNHAFGTFPVAGPPERQMRLSIREPHARPNRFLERVFGCEVWVEAYRGYIANLLASAFQPDRLNAQIDAIAKQVRPVVRDESPEALRLFDQSVAGFDTYPEDGRSGLPGPGRRQIAHPLKPWIAGRHASLQDQLAGKASGEPPMPRRFGTRPGPPEP